MQNYFPWNKHDYLVNTLALGDRITDKRSPGNFVGCIKLLAGKSLYINEI